MFFDSHTHIQFPAYDPDRDAVIARAKEAGVKMILVGTQQTTSHAGIVLAEQHPGDMWATAGFHPAHISRDWHHDENEQYEPRPETFDLEALRIMALNPTVVGIGECGLDYFHLAHNPDPEGEIKKQADVFAAQVALSEAIKKPLMIHCRSGSPQRRPEERTSPLVGTPLTAGHSVVDRSAFVDLLSLLDSASALRKGPNPGVIHFFTGRPDDAKSLLEFGFSFTFGGVITFTRDYDEVIKMIPADRILSETDAPYVAPVPYRGKRNEPAYIVETVKKLAELKNLSVDQMADQIRENAKRIFSIG